MGSSVSLVKVESQSNGVVSAVSKALDLIDFKFPAKVKSVIIKPNLCYYWNSSTGQTTDPQIVAAIIDCLREKCGNDLDIKIAEADASAMRTKYAFPVLGYTKLAEEKNVKLLNLSEDDLVETKINVNDNDLTFKLPQALLKSDLFINVPKLKIMKTVMITCAMKNIFGANGLPRKVKYHKVLNEAIVGINKLLPSHLTIVDGLVALGRQPIRLNLLMAGTDNFSVDWVASQVMGYNPRKIDFLKMAIKEGAGSPDGIKVIGEDLSKFSKIFPKAGGNSSQYAWKLQLSMLKIYQKLSGDIIPPMLEE